MTIDAATPELLEEALRQQLGDAVLSVRDRGMKLGNLAELLVMKGETGEAGDLFHEALSLLVEPCDLLQVLCGYARLVTIDRRHNAAHRLATEINRHLGIPETAAFAPWGYAWRAQLFILAGALPDAAAAADCAVSAARACGRGTAEAYSALAMVRELQGDPHGAIAALENAMVSMRSGHCLMEARAERARLALMTGDRTTAVRSLTRAVELPDLRDRRVIAQVLATIAQLGQHDPTAAVQLTSTLAAHLANPTQRGGFA